jgi:Putative transposase of IS4/5 family (DUF4096)
VTFHRIRTGAHWRDLPERFGPWKTVSERHRLWPADGTWEYLLQQIQAAADADGEVDWDISVDSSTVRAHQHAAGARIAPPAPVQREAGSELTGEAARLSLCDRLAEVVQAPKGSAAHAGGFTARIHLSAERLPL